MFKACIIIPKIKNPLYRALEVQGSIHHIIPTHVHTYLLTCLYTYTYLHVLTYIHTYIYTHIHTYVHADIHACTHSQTCIHACSSAKKIFRGVERTNFSAIGKTVWPSGTSSCFDRRCSSWEQLLPKNGLQAMLGFQVCIHAVFWSFLFCKQNIFRSDMYTTL